MIIQFSGRSAYNKELLEEINSLCSKYSVDFVVRFYGHYSDSFDCKWLEMIPDAKVLHIDCLMRADNLDVVKSLPNLRELSLGVFELKDTEIMNSPCFTNLTTLYLTETRTKALNLEYLKNLQNLRKLYLTGHTKNIDAIGELPHIEDLGLHSITKKPFTFINNLDRLKSLRITLGGRPNLDEIGPNNIELLQIIWVRGFCEFNNIANFQRLKELQIEDEIQLKSLSITVPMESLVDFKLLNCKSCQHLNGLKNLTNLHQLRINKTNIDLDLFLQQEMPKKLEILAFYTTKKKIDEEIYRKLKSLGYKNGLEDR